MKAGVRDGVCSDEQVRIKDTEHEIKEFSKVNKMTKPERAFVNKQRGSHAQLMVSMSEQSNANAN